MAQLKYAARKITVDAALRDAQNAPRGPRIAAITALADAEGARREEVTACLLRSLAAADGEVRQAAAISLGKLRCEAALEQLGAIVRDDADPRARQGAVAALGDIGDDRALPLLVAACADPEADVRFHAVAALCEAAPVAAPPLLERLLEDPDPEVRGSAVAALGDLRHAAAASRIVPLLDDADVSVRIEAAVALARVGDTRGVETLALHLAHPDFGAIVAEQLYLHPSERAAPALLRQLRRPFADPTTGVWVAGALARLGRPEGRNHLLRVLRSHNSTVCGLTIQVLGQLENAWARQALEALASSPAGANWREELVAALAGERAAGVSPAGRR